MKKILIVAVVVALVLGAAAGSSFYIGAKIARQLPDELRKAEGRIGGIPLTLKEAHQGVFESRYVIAATIPVVGPGVKTPVLVPVEVTSRVVHGPIPLGAGSFMPRMFVSDSTFALAATADPAMRDEFAKIPELAQSVIHVRGNLGGAADVSITVPPFSRDLPREDGATFHVDWKGLFANANIRQDATVTGTFEVPGLEMRTGQDAVVLSGLSGTFASKALEGMSLLSTGDARYALKLLDVNAPSTDTAFSLLDVTVDGHLTARGPVVDYNLVLKGVRRAPGVQDIPATLAITLRSLHAKALDDLLTLLQKARFYPEERPSPTEFIRIAAGLLSGSPGLELNVQAMEGTPAGPISFKAQVNTDQMKTLPFSLASAWAQLRANASLDASEKSFLLLSCLIARAKTPELTDEQCQAQTAQAVDGLVAAGRLIRAGGKLASEAVWDGQSLLINGKLFQ